MQLITDVLEGSRGLRLEALWRDLATAQSNTGMVRTLINGAQFTFRCIYNRHLGRDSVLAQSQRNDQVDNARVQTPVSQEHKDRDLIARLRKQLAEGRNPYDLAELRAKCKEKDTSKVGKLKRDEVGAQVY
jgi:hypothetical protein